MAGLEKSASPIFRAWIFPAPRSGKTACVSPRPASGRNWGNSSAPGTDDQKAERTTGPAVRLSDVLAIVIGFFVSFWLRFHSGLLRVPKGIPRFSSYLIIIPFLLFIHLVYFSYQGFYRFKLRRNRLDDLFSGHPEQRRCRPSPSC